MHEHTNTTSEAQHIVLVAAPGEAGTIVGPFASEDAMWDYVQANRYCIPRTVAPGKRVTNTGLLASAFN